MIDQFADHPVGLESPAVRIFEVTPSNDLQANRLPWVTRGLNVATSGYVRVETVEHDVGRVFVVAGVAFPLRCVRVFAEGTTATGITALA